jgi:hypothetical protein
MLSAQGACAAHAQSQCGCLKQQDRMRSDLSESGEV